jgi:hypothetical protein
MNSEEEYLNNLWGRSADQFEEFAASLLQAAAAKEYDASWRGEGQKVFRIGGRFASKGDQSASGGNKTVSQTTAMVGKLQQNFQDSIRQLNPENAREASKVLANPHWKKRAQELSSELSKTSKQLEKGFDKGMASVNAMAMAKFDPKRKQQEEKSLQGMMNAIENDEEKKRIAQGAAIAANVLGIAVSILVLHKVAPPSVKNKIGKTLNPGKAEYQKNLAGVDEIINKASKQKDALDVDLMIKKAEQSQAKEKIKAEEPKNLAEKIGKKIRENVKGDQLGDRLKTLEQEEQEILKELKLTQDRLELGKKAKQTIQEAEEERKAQGRISNIVRRFVKPENLRELSDKALRKLGAAAHPGKTITNE